MSAGMTCRGCAYMIFSETIHSVPARWVPWKLAAKPKPSADQELTGFPIVVSMVEVIPLPAASVAVVTLLALNENPGGTLVPAAGAIVHCASVNPHNPDPEELDVRPRFALAKCPVSVLPTKR